MRPDLHLHSTASDGSCTPEELARMAAEAGLDMIALTDHDSVEGIPRCARECARLGVRFLPGIELSTGGERDVHLLGYGIDPARMKDRLTSLKGDRRTRMEKTVEKIRECGMDVTMEDVLKMAGGAPLGRPHAALVLVQKGYASSVKNAFDRFLGDRRPCCVTREKLSFPLAVEWIHECGGKAIVAHPALIRTERRMLTQLLAVLLEQGADGLEAFHSAHTPSDAREIESFARRRGALVTGGSDFHGAIKSVRMEDGLRCWTRRSEDLERLLEGMQIFTQA